MSKISGILEEKTTFSYEFFPPNNATRVAALHTVVNELAVTNPDFISVTYGALGNSREATKSAVIEQNNLRSFPTMAHLTCVGHSRGEIKKLLDDYNASGVENIMALRGDGDAAGDFKYAVDLVEFIKNLHPDMSVGVAAHPEVHPNSPNRNQDRVNLATKMKVADFAITQFFFDAEHYHRMMGELDSLRIDKPIIPGIMLFLSKKGLFRMADMNNTSLPKELEERLETLEQPADISKLAVETAAGLVEKLDEYDIPGIHIYTLNRSKPVLELNNLVRV